MVETPAAALTAASLAEDAAFFSIGSNNLSQYTLARDRTNPAVAAGLDGLHPAVLRLLPEPVRLGAIHGRWKRRTRDQRAMEDRKSAVGRAALGRAHV